MSSLNSQPTQPNQKQLECIIRISLIRIQNR